MPNFQTLPGFREFYPDELAGRNHIFRLWRQTASSFGFAEYDAPVLEPLELYKAKSGDEIEAQLFSFTDKGGRDVALDLEELERVRQADVEALLLGFLALFLRRERGAGGLDALVVGFHLARGVAHGRGHLLLGVAQLQFGLLLLQARDMANSIQPKSAPGNRILIADSAVLSVKLLCDVLEGVGTLRFALSTDDALEMATAWVPDLILMDVNMGDVSGIELCRRIKSTARTANCVVVFLSSDVDVHVEISGLTAGAIDFLEKPINPARVVGRIRAHLFNARRQAASASMHEDSVMGELTGFVACDVDGKVLEISPSLTRFLSKPPQEILGREFADLFDGERVAGPLDL